MNIDELVPKQALEAETWPCYVLDADGLIIYANAAWDRAAAEANGPSADAVTDTPWMDHIAGEELRSFYQALFQRVMERGAGERHLGDCNTPSGSASTPTDSIRSSSAAGARRRAWWW